MQKSATNGLNVTFDQSSDTVMSSLAGTSSTPVAEQAPPKRRAGLRSKKQT